MNLNFLGKIKNILSSRINDNESSFDSFKNAFVVEMTSFFTELFVQKKLKYTIIK